MVNNKIYEEALAGALRRIEVLEDKFEKLQKPQKSYKPIDAGATSSQIWRIEKEGGDPTGMTRIQATIEIDRLIKEKQGIFSGSIPSATTPRPQIEIPEVIEPAEVDKDDAGLDEEGLM